ncbi:MAG: hypothetical protein ACREXT_18975, partial [Gammaproteobacteria bacterium]
MDAERSGAEYAREPAREIDQRVFERRLQTAFDNSRFALFPLFISVLCYAGLMANFVPRRTLAIWLFVVLGLVSIRGLLAVAYRRTRDKIDSRWINCQAAIMAALGVTYGITPLWIQVPEQIWLLAIVNLWLGGLAVAALIGQGIVPVLGLSFAIPVMAP